MLYTDKIQDPKLAAVIRGIPAKRAKPFATPILASDLMKDAPVWFYAAIPGLESNLWDLKEIVAFPNRDGFDVQQKTIHSNIHFFDALSLCAEKEFLQTRLGKHEITDQSIKAKLHHGDFIPWKVMANDAGQPLDNTGMPIPSGNGRILVDGTFSSNALDVAGKTKNKPLTPLKAEVPSILGGLGDSPFETNDERLEQLRENSRTVAAFSKATEMSKKALKNLHYKYKKNKPNYTLDLSGDSTGIFIGAHFAGHLLFYVCGAALTVSSGPAWIALPIAWRGLQTLYRPKDQINIAFLKASMAANALPDGPEKQMIQEFNKLVRGTYYLERAANDYNIYRHDHQKTQNLSRAIKFAQKGLSIMDTPAEDSARVIHKMMEGEFPKHLHFYGLMKERLEIMRGKLQPLLTLEAQKPLKESAPEQWPLRETTPAPYPKHDTTSPSGPEI